jgi:hypothetical protein
MRVDVMVGDGSVMGICMQKRRRQSAGGPCTHFPG